MALVTPREITCGEYTVHVQSGPLGYYGVLIISEALADEIISYEDKAPVALADIIPYVCNYRVCDGSTLMYVKVITKYGRIAAIYQGVGS